MFDILTPIFEDMVVDCAKLTQSDAELALTTLADSLKSKSFVQKVLVKYVDGTIGERFVLIVPSSEYDLKMDNS